jgi:hypothetical protein
MLGDDLTGIGLLTGLKGLSDAVMASKALPGPMIIALFLNGRRTALLVMSIFCFTAVPGRICSNLAGIAQRPSKTTTSLGATWVFGWAERISIDGIKNTTGLT